MTSDNDLMSSAPLDALAARVTALNDLLAFARRAESAQDTSALIVAVDGLEANIQALTSEVQTAHAAVEGLRASANSLQRSLANALDEIDGLTWEVTEAYDEGHANGYDEGFGDAVDGGYTGLEIPDPEDDSEPEQITVINADKDEADAIAAQLADFEALPDEEKQAAYEALPDNMQAIVRAHYGLDEAA